MNGIVDFHSHILPGIDDGSRSVEQSIAMLQRQAQQGIKQVIATPHFYAHSDDPKKFLRRRAEAETLLRAEMEKHTDLPKLSVGAEVYYFNGIADSEVLSELTIDKKRYILIEMPMSPWTDRMYRDLEGIWIRQGLMPVVAHIDRYISPFRTYGIPERLADLPVIVQANASFFLHRSTKNMALRMLRKGRIHLLGSDCHDLKDRAPNLGEAVDTIEKKLGRDSLRRIGFYQEEVLTTL